MTRQTRWVTGMAVAVTVLNLTGGTQVVAANSARLAEPVSCNIGVYPMAYLDGCYDSSGDICNAGWQDLEAACEAVADEIVDRCGFDWDTAGTAQYVYHSMGACFEEDFICLHNPIFNEYGSYFVGCWIDLEPIIQPAE